MSERHGGYAAHAAGLHVPTLVIRDSDSVSPAPLAGDTESLLWRDKDQRVVGAAYTAGNLHVVHLRGIARFEFEPGSREVQAWPELNVSSSAVLDTYRRWVLPVAVQTLGPEVLHASAVVRSDGVVAFCAASESGKSTIAYGLSQRGYSLFADDAVAFERVEGGLMALPLPFSLRLRPASAVYFGLGDQRLESAVAGAREPAPLTAIFLLRRGTDVAPRAVGVAKVQALPDLLAQSYHFGGEKGERKRRMLETYLALSTSVPIFDLHMPIGIERLPMILDEVEDALAAHFEAA